MTGSRLAERRVDRSIRVLVVDDEPDIRDIVRGYLERETLEVMEAGSGPMAVELARAARPDVVVLDLMLPGFDGLEVCRQLRTFSDAYVIMLTARTEEVDRIVGLSLGADDYLAKPFSPRELVARVRALLRRPRATSAEPASDRSPVLERAGLRVDERRRDTRIEGRPVELTPIEFDLLTALMREPGVVFTRQQLLDRVWGSDFFGADHIVDVHIGNLRRKLAEDPMDPRYIGTVRGVGYRFQAG